MRKLFFIYIALNFAIVGFAQQTVKLNINHKLLNQNFAFNQTSTNNLNNAFNLIRLQYYMSGFAIIHDGAQTSTTTSIYELVDASTITSINLGSFPGITNIEGIKFSIGVNQPENNQDPSLWTASHPLSPKSPSMHWGWASGYFFVALEGKSSPLLDQQLELLALDNINYFSQVITTSATANAGELIITINADYAQGLKNIDISNGLVAHGSAGVDSVIIANFRDHVFSAVTTTLSSIQMHGNAVSNSVLIVYPNPSSTGVFSVKADTHQKTTTSVVVTDVTGRVLQNKKLTELINDEISIQAKGIYFISLINDNETVATQKLIVY